MSDPKSEIVFGKEKPTPQDEARYKQQIQSAKNKLNKSPDPVGIVPKQKLPSYADVRAAEEAQELQMATREATRETSVKPRPPGSPVLTDRTLNELQGFSKAVADQTEAEKRSAIAAEKAAKEQESQETESSRLFADLLDSPEAEAIRAMSSRKRRNDIESRCLPMKFEDLLIKNEVRQLVPIIPGKFEAVYRSITPEENLFIKILMSKEKVTTDSYVGEKFSLYQLAFSLVSINGIELPSHLDQMGEPTDELVATKLRAIQKKSGYIVADLHQNFIWFDLRVRKLFNPDELKNG